MIVKGEGMFCRYQQWTAVRIRRNAEVMARRNAIAYFCIHMYTKYNYNRKTNPDPATAQPRSKSSLRNTLTFKNKSILTARKKAGRGC